LKEPAENERMLKFLCEHLNNDFEKIIGFNPILRTIKNMDQEAYTVYVSNTQKGLVFTFGCEHEKDEGLAQKIEGIRNINLLKVFYIRVDPTGLGIGTKIWEKFLKRVRALEGVKTIRLSATKPRAIKFWRKLGFEKEIESPGNYEKMIFYL
jgi:ribosomal protein S18 acetylase RimI-like enzyme